MLLIVWRFSPPPPPSSSPCFRYSIETDKKKKKQEEIVCHFSGAKMCLNDLWKIDSQFCLSDAVMGMRNDRKFDTLMEARKIST